MHLYRMYWLILSLLLDVVGVKGLSLAHARKSILEVSVDCGANAAANSPVISILTDVEISASAKCQGGDKVFVSDDSVHYTLPAAFTARDSRCLFYQREASLHYYVDVEVHYGERGSLIMTKQKIITTTCNFGDHGTDDSAQHSIREGPIAPIEIQSIVGDTIPSSDLTLRIQTVDDQDAVSPIALDRRYSVYGTYTGSRTNVGLKPVSCDAVSDSGERYSVLRAGCGDGLIFDRSDGFTTLGTTFRSPYFVAFHLSSSTNLAFDCNVTLCSPSCDGSSCEIFCGTVTNFPLSNAALDQCSGELYQDTCTFSCDNGYDQTGNGISSCGADGIWTSPSITCTPKDCGDPPSGTNADVSFTDTTFTSTATYTCQSGYTFSDGHSSLDCLPSGNWQTPPLECIANDCGDPPSGINADVSFTATTYSSTATYTCKSGYTYSAGDSSLDCEADGNWETPPLECIGKPSTCLVVFGPSNPLELTFHILDIMVEGQCDFLCNQLYFMMYSYFDECWCAFDYLNMEIEQDVCVEKNDFVPELSFTTGEWSHTIGSCHPLAGILAASYPTGNLNASHPTLSSTIGCANVCRGSFYFAIHDGVSCYCFDDFMQLGETRAIEYGRCIQPCQSDPGVPCVVPGTVLFFAINRNF